jgi:hypothetical protein
MGISVFSFCPTRNIHSGASEFKDQSGLHSNFGMLAISSARQSEAARFGRFWWGDAKMGVFSRALRLWVEVVT